MRLLIQELENYVLENPLNVRSSDSNSLYEFFGSHYMAHHPIESDEIREKLCSLEPIMKLLSKRRERCLIHTVKEVCAEYERTAFFEGLRVGAQLIMELDKLS